MAGCHVHARTRPPRGAPWAGTTAVVRALGLTGTSLRRLRRRNRRRLNGRPSGAERSEHPRGPARGRVQARARPRDLAERRGPAL